MICHEFIAGRKDSLLLIIDFQVEMITVIFLSTIHSFRRNNTFWPRWKPTYVPLHLVVDAVASRVKENRDTAIDLLRQPGAIIS